MAEPWGKHTLVCSVTLTMALRCLLKDKKHPWNKKGGNLGEEGWPTFQKTFGKFPKSSEIWALRFMKVAIRPVEGLLRVLVWHLYGCLEVTEKRSKLKFEIDMFCLLFCVIVILCWREWFTRIREWPVIGLLSETNKKTYNKSRQVILKVVKTWDQVQC